MLSTSDLQPFWRWQDNSPKKKTNGADRVTKYTWMEASPSEDKQNRMTTFQKTLGSLGIKCCSSGEYPWAMIEKKHRLFALQPFMSDENQVSRWKCQRVQFGFQSFFRSSRLLTIDVSTLECILYLSVNLLQFHRTFLVLYSPNTSFQWVFNISLFNKHIFIQKLCTLIPENTAYLS